MIALGILLTASLVLLAVILDRASAQDCEADGTCHVTQQRCDVISQAANVCATPLSIYGSGGTAVAYTPNQPASATICEIHSAASAAASSMSHRKYRIARWPFARSTWKQAPEVQLELKLFGCSQSSKGTFGDDMCCCSALKEAEVEVWQARPDGTYSSLGTSSGGDCRARGQSTGGTGGITFETLAPGSTGSLGGLGPSGWDFPYGPPVIHILIKSVGFANTLVDLPVVINMRTMEQGSFGDPIFVERLGFGPKKFHDTRLLPGELLWSKIGLN